MPSDFAARGGEPNGLPLERTQFAPTVVSIGSRAQNDTGGTWEVKILRRLAKVNSNKSAGRPEQNALNVLRGASARFYINSSLFILHSSLRGACAPIPAAVPLRAVPRC
jgi:hypothetical protein